MQEKSSKYSLLKDVFILFVKSSLILKTLDMTKLLIYERNLRKTEVQALNLYQMVIILILLEK